MVFTLQLEPRAISLVFRDEKVEPNVTSFAGHVISATKESSVVVDYVNVPHYNSHLQATDGAFFAIIGD